MRESTVIPMLRRVASLRLTLVGLVLLALGLVADQKQWLSGAWSITPPLALLALNLAASLVVDPRFRRKPALFAFHVCLLLLGVLAGYGQLARIDARLALADGQEFSADLLQLSRQGPFKPAMLGDRAFVQGAIAVDYAPGIRRGATRSRVWVADRGWLEIGDDIPLLVDGYRIYTTSNKGFAALLTWLPADDRPQLGVVNFPSYPATELGQSLPWTTPGGQLLDLALLVPPSPYNQSWTLSKASAQGAELEIDAGGSKHRLQAGEMMALDGGVLRFEQVSMWMGYELTFDPTLPWLFSLSVLAVIFMALHFATRVARPARSGAVAGSRSPA